eukprot:scaffold991_cov128-Cylindrotheca_fusiformis.AAC.4
MILRLLILVSALLNTAASESCERLKATLTYTQEEAPRDLSTVLPVVVEKVNRVLDGVVDVEVEWKGADLHGRVGEHIVECTVTRLASAVPSSGLEVVTDAQGREVTSQCFHVPFTILDTNECTLAARHRMRHACPAPSVCVNTVGSYECVCPTLSGKSEEFAVTVGEDFWENLAQQHRSPWELSFAADGKSTCISSATTHGCCPASSTTADGHSCRKNFHCPSDPCIKSDCASNAQCIRADSPWDVPNYKCQCPEGLMGNGRACQPNDPKPTPKVMFDGVTPTETTVKNGYYCGCTRPVVDACSGFPPCKGNHEICTVTKSNEPVCACKPGYVHHETYGCVDESPPILKLRNDPNRDQTLRLQQGDVYQEHMVDIIDENAEDYLRSLKISYSQPLPTGCLTQVGEFHVNYTVAMPWTTPPYVRITRRVVIDDIDECAIQDVSKFQHSCPALVPQCDRAAGAKCINTIGSYACKCPSQSSGDGFLPSATFGPGMTAPSSYKGGTSCLDTSKPVISLNGPNPKIFRICECGGLTGVMSKAKSPDDAQLHNDQQRLYAQDIKEMIRGTSGAELCATYSNTNPSPSDCIKAVDHTYQGDIDLSDRVTVGEPVQKSALHWVVPYNVKDDAGNEAVTVWRDVVVQEVDLSSLESKIREEVIREQKAERQRAIDVAIQREKAQWAKDNRSGGNNRNRRNCPTCPPCNCPDISSGTCIAYCDGLSASCQLSDESLVYAFLFRLNELCPPTLVPIVALGIVIIVVFTVLRFLITCCFSQRPYNSRYGYDDYNNASAEESLVLQSSTPTAPSNSSNGRTPMSSPLRSSANNPNNNIDGGMNPPFFSPAASVHNGGGSNTPMSGANRDVHHYDNSIYNDTVSITPSRTGDGVRRRNPYT